jgi:MoaA/NifB/PqqE/SkfB family radical SAM enzyme
MFNYDKLESVHVEITNRCQASCPMCLRNHHGDAENPLLKLTDWSLTDFQNIFDNKTLEIISRVEFCGNYGDPLLNKDLQLMTNYVMPYNIFVDIHTNGSLRSRDFWKQFPKHLPNHRVVFGIDGLSDTHGLYRRGTDFNKIIENAKIFIDNGGNAEWSFIKFKHNEHQVDQARKLASNIGFAKFYTKDSNRYSFEKSFPVYNENRKTLYNLEPPTSNRIKYTDPNNIDTLKSIVEQSSISCYAKHKKEIYIDAHKKIMPCCFLAASPYDYTTENDSLHQAKKQIAQQYKQLIAELGNTDAMLGIETVVNSDSFQSVWEKYWTINKLWMCARVCGEVLDQPNQQVNAT